jgi:hypothetical protein
MQVLHYRNIHQRKDILELLYSFRLHCKNDSKCYLGM